MQHSSALHLVSAGRSFTLQYAGRDCACYLMDTGKAEQWAKLYVDKLTGVVLFCDAETFRLRTATIEELPVDKALFAAPDGLKYSGGDGK